MIKNSTGQNSNRFLEQGYIQKENVEEGIRHMYICIHLLTPDQFIMLVKMIKVYGKPYVKELNSFNHFTKTRHRKENLTEQNKRNNN